MKNKNNLNKYKKHYLNKVGSDCPYFIKSEISKSIKRIECHFRKIKNNPELLNPLFIDRKIREFKGEYFSVLLLAEIQEFETFLREYCSNLSFLGIHK